MERLVAVVVLLSFAVLTVVASGQERSEFVHQRMIRVAGPDGDSQRVLVTFPRRPDGRDHPPDQRYPIVIALSGLGEALKGPERGVLGWAVDYRLPDAYAARGAGRLDAIHYRSFITPGHLSMVNDELRRRPYRGVMVITPYTPNLMERSSGSAELRNFGDWLAGPLLEQVRSQFPGAARGRDATGIDGVSLGGMLSLEIGLSHSQSFGAVGAIQPAIRNREESLADAAQAARQSGHHQELRLLTSGGDPFKPPTRRLSELLRERQVPHTLLELPGPHDYSFNQGPGILELLRFGERALAAEPAGP